MQKGVLLVSGNNPKLAQGIPTWKSLFFFLTSMVSPLLAFWAGTSGLKNKAGCGKAQNGCQTLLFVKPFEKGGWVDIMSLKRISVLLVVYWWWQHTPS